MPETKLSLNVIKVATPCHESWDAMHGKADKRFCDSCEKHVFNLSEMTADEARDVVTQYAGSPEGLCVRYKRDHAGQMITTDHPAPESRPGRLQNNTRRASRRMAGTAWEPLVLMMSFGAMATSFLAGVSAMFFGGPAVNNDVPANQPPPGEIEPQIMGMICPPQPPQPAPQPVQPPEIMGEMEMIMGDVVFEEPIRQVQPIPPQDQPANQPAQN